LRTRQRHRSAASSCGGIISDDHGDLPATGPPWSLLHDLPDVVRCDAVAFFELDSGRQAGRLTQAILA
jgi:hypothetical protein